MFQIRKANLSDLPQLQVLFVNTIKSTCKDDYTQKQIDVWTFSVHNTEKWKNRILKQYFLVAELKGIIVGFCSLENNYLDVIYVHKDHLRQGIADKLYTTIENEAIKTKANTIEVDASITAKPFFERKGFRILRENKNQLKGIEIINYRMIKHLQT